MSELNVANRTLYHGDNLDFLRGMNSGTVNLIATDPPFKKNRDFHATPDSLAKGASFQDRWRWGKDVHEDWVDSIKDNWPKVWSVIDTARSTYGDDMGAFLCWLGVRLLEMHRILRDDGSIYLHIDHTAHAYTKCLLDAIFGRRKFRNEIVWFYKTGGVSKNWFGRKHDTILFYSKSDKYTFTLGKEKSYLSHKYGFPNVEISEDEQGFFTMVGMRDVWDIPALRGNQPETTGFPTQKPLALYERIIQASSNIGDVVLDPFCGCATTPVAAERLGRQWVGIDIWEGAYDQVLQRIADNRQLLTDSDPQIHYETTLPARTDANEIPVPDLRLRIQRPREPWERLTNREVRVILEKAQAVDELIGCAGCGRVLEGEFMELDHLQPKPENGPDHLINRILLCRPCNGRKSNQLTMAGLRRQNNQAGWMRDANLAEQTQQKALLRVTRVRDDWGTPGFQWDEF